MKKGKAVGIDSITVEMLKADVDTTTNMLHKLFQKIWDQEILDDWSKSLIVKLPKKGDFNSMWELGRNYAYTNSSKSDG